MSDKYFREHFEQGCLCILTDRLLMDNDESDEDAVARYIHSCKCSRHPDGSLSANYDGELEKIMLKEVKYKRSIALFEGICKSEEFTTDAAHKAFAGVKRGGNK